MYGCIPGGQVKFYRDLRGNGVQNTKIHKKIPKSKYRGDIEQVNYRDARYRLAAGGCIYRSGWKPGEYLALCRYKGNTVIVKYQHNHPCGIWVADPEDLSADDWCTELFVSLRE